MKATVKSIERSMPVIKYITDSLANMKQLVKIDEDDASKITLLGLEDNWITSGKGSIKSNMPSISCTCNLSCQFCFRKGNPPISLPQVVLYDSQSQLSLDEARCRCDNYRIFRDAETGEFVYKYLFPMHQDIGEFMHNPIVFDVLKMMRECAPHELMNFASNGTYLTVENIEKLSDIKPISLDVSLNSANPRVRSELMQDKYPMTAIKSIEMLNKEKIRYKGSIVAWHTLELSDIENTLNYLEENNAAWTKIDLPGYSRFFSERQLYDREELWPRVIEFIRSIRGKYTMPIMWQPYINEWQNGITPEIPGAVKNSPAYHAGLRPGDVIVEIDGQEVKYLKELIELLKVRKYRDSRIVKYMRNNVTTEVRLSTEDADVATDKYPYKPAHEPYYLDPEYGRYYGILLPEGFDYRGLRRIEDLVKQSEKIANVLLVSTKTMINSVRMACLMEYGTSEVSYGSIKLNVIVAEHNFWGGNIVIGDILTVQDYIETIAKYCSNNVKPDLVVLPSSAFSFGKDVLGVSYKKIQRSLGINIELIHTNRIIY